VEGFEETTYGFSQYVRPQFEVEEQNSTMSAVNNHLQFLQTTVNLYDGGNGHLDLCGSLESRLERWHRVKGEPVLPFRVFGG
jgi:hypothetical protein